MAPLTGGKAGAGHVEEAAQKTYWLWFRHSGQDEIEEGTEWSTLGEPIQYTQDEIEKVTKQGFTVTHLKCRLRLPEFLGDCAPNLKHLEVSGGGSEKPATMIEKLNRILPKMKELTELNLSVTAFEELPIAACDLPSLKHIKMASTAIKTLPPEMKRLTKLESLNISGNTHMHGKDLPPVIWELTSLKDLSISWCNLKVPDNLSKLVNLEKLDMRDNALNEFPETVCSLLSLKELNLQACLLKDLPASFANLVNLERLNIRGNPLEKLPAAICELKSLKELQMYRCELTTLPDRMAKLADTLELLNVDENGFDTLPEVITKLVNLKELHIADCPIDTLPLSFKKLQKLETLSLARRKSSNFNRKTTLPDVITEIPSLKKLSFNKSKLCPDKFARLCNLEDLYISDSAITDEDLEAISTITSLEVLTMRRCLLKTLPNSFKNLKKLRSLDVEGNLFQTFPSVIVSLTELYTINLRYLDKLTSLDKDIVTLPKLEVMSLRGCEKLVSPPYEICGQGLAAIRQYYADMKKGKGNNLPVAVVAVIGRKLAGKTSLVKTLQNRKAQKRVLTYRGPDEAKDEATKVFNVENVNTGNTILRFIDVGGHDIYQLAYQLTLRKNCIPVIVINIYELKLLSEDLEVGVTEAVRRLGFDWMSHLYIGCPKLGPPKLIFTHSDMVSDDEFSKLQELFLHTMDELKAELIVDESELDSSFEQIAHLSDPTKPVFAEQDIFVIGKNDNYQAFENILQVLEQTCMQFSREIPDSWEMVGKILEGQAGCCVDMTTLRTLAKKNMLEYNKIKIGAGSTDPLEVILGYLHECGRVLWYKDIPELKKYIFHKISSVTKLISVLFHHTDDLVWEERLKNFKPFKTQDGVKIGKEYYEELVNNFQESGVMDKILLHHLIQQESEFKSNESLQVGINLLQTFRLLHGPINHQGAQCYIIPYFCKGFQSDTLLMEDQFLNLKADLKFDGLSLPRYVYHQMTLSLLEEFPDESDQAVVTQNGITVYHDTTNIRLTHDSNMRTVSIQTISDIESIEKTWQLFVSIINNAINETLKNWKAARPSCIFYCPHCLLKGTQHPKKTVNPSWCSTSPKYKKGKELQTMDGGGVSVCGQDRKVLKALLFPCKLNESGMSRLESYAKELHETKMEAASKQKEEPLGNTTIHRPTVTSQPAGDGDNISVVSDGFDYLVPVSEEQIDISFRPHRTTDQSVRRLFTNSDKVYKMTSPKRGRAIIINNMNFKDRDDAKRDGSDVDLRNVTRMFYELGFEICKHEDLTAKEMLEAVRKETEDILHEDFGMFALVIMTHGTEHDCFYGTDMKTVELVDICELLAARNFPAMGGKPKLIIVQACGGEKADFGGGGHHAEEKVQPDTEAANSRTSQGMNKSLNVDDLLIIKSSFENQAIMLIAAGQNEGRDQHNGLICYSSIRNTSHGSLFIRALVATFLKHAAHRDVYTLHEIMQERVRRTSMELSRRHPAHNIGGQTVICIKTLTRLRKLYLFPLYDGPRQMYTKDRIQLIEVDGDIPDIELAGVEIDGTYNTDRMGRVIQQTDTDDIWDLEADGDGYTTDRVRKVVVGEDDGAMWGRDGVRPKAKADTTSSQAKQTETATASCTCCVM